MSLLDFNNFIFCHYQICIGAVSRQLKILDICYNYTTQFVPSNIFYALHKKQKFRKRKKVLPGIERENIEENTVNPRKKLINE